MAGPRKKKAKKDTSFATWKFNLENTVNADPMTDGSCLQLVRAYLDFMSSPDIRPYQSIINLKVATGLHEGAISRARALLVKLGYFTPDGTTQTGAVKYKIVNARENIVLDHQIAARETFKAIDAEKKKKTREKRKIFAIGSATTADLTSPAESADLNGKRVCDFEGDSSAATADNYVYNTVEVIGIEEEVTFNDTPFDPSNSYIAVQIGDEANQPLPIPEDDFEAESMMNQICAGAYVLPAIRRRMLSMLKLGILTPNLANGMVGKRKASVA